MPQLVIDPGAGFCPGVKRAIKGALEYAALHRQVYSLGALIHNPIVLRQLEAAGITTVDELAAIPAGSRVIIRAHGVPPATEMELHKRKIPYLDLTCPTVKKVQQTILRYRSQGCRVLIVGKPDHPETRGLKGYAGTAGLVLRDLLAAGQTSCQAPAVLLAQTTTSAALFREIQRDLAARIPELESVNTLCSFVMKRQEWITAQATRCDASLIVGGKQSSNTAQLYNIASARGPAFWIEEAEELDDLNWPSGWKVAFTAGTSTPEALFNRVQEVLTTRHGFTPWVSTT